jgi:hypothetical protein
MRDPQNCAVLSEPPGHVAAVSYQMAFSLEFIVPSRVRTFKEQTHGTAMIW